MRVGLKGPSQGPFCYSAFKAALGYQPQGLKRGQCRKGRGGREEELLA